MAIVIDEERSAKYANIKCLRFNDPRYRIPWTSVSVGKNERLVIIADPDSEYPDSRLLIRIKDNNLARPTFICDEEMLHRGQFKVVR